MCFVVGRLFLIVSVVVGVVGIIVLVLVGAEVLIVCVEGNGVFCGRNPFLASATLEREGFFRVVALSWYCSFCVDGYCFESAWFAGVCCC